MASVAVLQNVLVSEGVQVKLDSGVIIVAPEKLLKSAALVASESSTRLDILDAIIASEWKQEFRVLLLLRSSVFSAEFVLATAMERLPLERRYRVPSVFSLYSNARMFEKTIERAYGVDFIPAALDFDAEEIADHSYYLRKDFSQGREVL